MHIILESDGVFMNGFTMMADSYKKLMNEGKIEKEVAEKKIRIYEFLATCDMDDFCTMVDSSAFNDIIKGYVATFLKQGHGDLFGDEAIKVAMRDMDRLFSEESAKEVLGSSK